MCRSCGQGAESSRCAQDTPLREVPEGGGYWSDGALAWHLLRNGDVTGAKATGVRRLAKTLRLAVGLVSKAAPRELTVTIALTLVRGFITAGELLIGRELVQLLLAADSSTSKTATSARVSDLVPWLIALAGIMILSAVVNVSIAELRTLLNELVYRRAVDQLLEASTAAELESFDDADFHDSIQRARENADQNAWQVVWGLISLLTTAVSAVAVGAVLLSVAPVLLPVAVAAYVPIGLTSIRNTNAGYRMHYGLAELDRDRLYHERLLTGRVEAKEVRAFGLASWLRTRHDELFAERVARTRRLVVKRAISRFWVPP